MPSVFPRGRCVRGDSGRSTSWEHLPSTWICCWEESAWMHPPCLRRWLEGSPTETTNPFISRSLEGFRQPQTVEFLIPCPLTERSRTMKNPRNWQFNLHPAAIFQGCYISGRNHFQAHLRAVALWLHTHLAVLSSLRVQTHVAVNPEGFRGQRRRGGILARQQPSDWPPETTSPPDGFQKSLCTAPGPGLVLMNMLDGTYL